MSLERAALVRTATLMKSAASSKVDDASLNEPQAAVAIEERMCDEEKVEMVFDSASNENMDLVSNENPAPVPKTAGAFEFTTLINDFSASKDNPNSSWTSFDYQQPINTITTVPFEIVYCRYPFLVITNIHRIPQQDVGFLELQGCLKVLTRPLLDEFVQQYFLHVHPILPVVNEGDFWDLYDHDSHQPLKFTVPLLLFQAMLFAASPFVSNATVCALGYTNSRSLRTTLLRRTKLLYDLESESSPLTIAQACILLSMASLSSTGKPNTIWLSLAIENAKLAEAHLYASRPSGSFCKEKNILKRLWWCCIIRDRSVGLLLKRQIKITKEQFDCDEDPLDANDLRDELQRSKVYSPSTKWKLAVILSQSVELYIKLTDVLAVIYPPNGKHLPGQQDHACLAPLYKCKLALRDWNAQTSSRLSDLQSNPDLITSPKAKQAKGHDSVSLYRNLMYMYYHTARIGICHHETLRLEGADLSFPLAKGLSNISEMQLELQRAITDITECHNELLRLGLTRWIPSTAIGFSALPLVLNIIDIKLAPPTMQSIHQSSVLVQNRLNVLIEFMRAYWARYDGVSWISEIVRHIIGLTQLNGLKSQRKANFNWMDIFAFQPRAYLRLVLVLDLSLNKGRMAQDSDFPAKLRGLFSVNLNPLNELVEGHLNSPENRLPLFRQPSQPPSLESVAWDQTQLHMFGLDDCPINLLENGIAFQQLIDPGLVQQENGADAGHLLSQPSVDLSDENHVLPNDLANSKTPTADREKNIAFVSSDQLFMSGLDTECVMDERLADHLLEAMLEEGLSEGISSA
ncbi:hypothetical protein BFJ63_vAg17415 [Fusarium oxysporum f. sp. narcissi]|uniref:Xylanolytic transcriptional activator regulatory domain-containing protein n=1 Tax=Fusarium oxysporum f. sp. narcissi TaxID=451672 RepID=A0A4Q2V6Z1_FUSOX|nr:hypothetical protein BFJ63_vAg17415 [Fusarium oxysporum f. sp. narcissi]